MAPAILTRLFVKSAAPVRDVVDDAAALGPFAARAVLAGRNLVPREQQHVDPSRGVIDPHNINNVGIFVLFGLIGVAFVVSGIWFFFWAKNGGFYYKETDWEDYKTTVLRRKGPNGTLLSNATKSTDLGGGSIYKDVEDRATTATGTAQRRRDDDDDGRTTITDSTYMTGITAGASDIGAREKRRKKKEARDRDRERRREEKLQSKLAAKAEKSEKSRRRVGPDGELLDEEAEAEAKAHLRSYRHERPARVGGLNKESEGSAWDGSTNPSASSAATETESNVTSELLSHRQHTPTSTPTKKTPTGIRKVYSTADRNAEREAERIRAEARRLQEKGRSAMSASGGAASSTGGKPRRDFSFQRADDSHRGPLLRRIDEGDSVVSGTSAADDRQTRVPGSWTESDLGTGSDLGTKTYHHPIPELSASSLSGSGVATRDFAYQEEKRKARRAAAGTGYRRGQ